MISDNQLSGPDPGNTLKMKVHNIIKGLVCYNALKWQRCQYRWKVLLIAKDLMQ